MELRSLDALKARLPEYLQSMGLEPQFKGKDKFTCRCPLHADSQPSFTADRKENGWVWYCFPCAKGGTVIDLHAALQGTNAAQAIRELTERFEAPLFAPLPAAEKPERKPVAWPVLRKGSESELAALAALRGLPLEAVRVTQMLGLLRFTIYHEMPCYALTDGGQVFLQLRRMDGEPFPFPKDRPIKAWNWPGCRLTPLGTQYLGWKGMKQPVLMAEGAIAILELYALLILAAESGLDPWDWSCLALTSASAPIPLEVLQQLEGRRVRILSDEDEAGEAARDRWTAQLRSVNCAVQHVNLSLVAELKATPHPDLGDFIKLPGSEGKQATLNQLLHL